MPIVALANGGAGFLPSGDGCHPVLFAIVWQQQHRDGITSVFSGLRWVTSIFYGVAPIMSKKERLLHLLV